MEWEHYQFLRERMLKTMKLIRAEIEIICVFQWDFSFN